MSLPINKVCIVGANGTIGSPITKALVQAGCFQVSVLRRTTSPSPSPAGVIEIPVSPALAFDELTRALAGQDAVVAAFPLKDVSEHLRLVEAAHNAGVRRYIPADYGSCDAASPQAQHHLKLYRDKAAVQARCEDLAKRASQHPATASALQFTWTSIVCGHFFDFGLASGLLHIDIQAERAQILDAGDIKASASTLHRVAESVVRVLQRHEVTRNRVLYVQSFCPTQLEILASAERATGTKWRTQHLDSNAFLERASQRLAAGDDEAVEDIVFVLGTVDADWTLKDGYVMELLGLQDEDMDKVIRDVIEGRKTRV